jgi:hypothetical protein
MLLLDEGCEPAASRGAPFREPGTSRASSNPPLKCVSMRRGTTRLVAMTTNEETGARGGARPVIPGARTDAHAEPIAIRRT